jgi:hypothetical protein
MLDLGPADVAVDRPVTDRFGDVPVVPLRVCAVVDSVDLAAGPNAPGRVLGLARSRSLGLPTEGSGSLTFEVLKSTSMMLSRCRGSCGYDRLP